MAKTSKGVILSQASQIKSDYSFALIKATADNKSLVQDASSAELKVNALVEYSKDSQWDPKKLTSLGFPAGCFLIVDLRGQDIHAADLITNLALVRQYGYQAGVIDDLSTLDDIKALKANQIYLINSGKTNDDQDASLNGNEITDGSGKLAVGMSVKWQRDYTNVDVSGDHAGFVGMGQDTLLKGGNAFGYSTNGRDFNAVITPKGLIFRRPDAERMWRLLKPNEIADINSTVGDKVKKEVDSATAEIPAAVSAANSAVSAAESAIAASKVNSDAIVAQSSAVIEAKSAMDSATAEIQQLKANAASDVAQIRADVAQVQNEVDTAKAANSASVDKLKSDIGLAQKDLDNVHDSLTKAQSAVEQNQKLINDSVTKINSDIAQSRQDIVTAQQANDDLAKQLDTYSKEAQEQGKTIKTIQDNQDGFSITIADVKGDVTKVSDTVDGLSAGLKDAQGNIASVKAQADQLNATLTDHSKDIAQLTATAKELSSTLEDANGRLSKVEQTASEQSTTLSDLQGNLTQVKQTADNLVTTLKDAQGNIDQIKQDAKGTLEQLSNAQGDITVLQKDVSGIKLTIADHDKNIHTLQADSKSLRDDMKDAQGNISSLQKTATSLDSEFEDHNGRISKVEQTASKLTNEFSDQQGRLNKVEQTADGTQQTVANQQGQINTIKTDTAGIHETLTGQGNQIANINVTLSGLNSKYEGVSGDLGKLKSQAQWVTVTSAVDLNNVKTPCHEFLKGTVTNAPNEAAWWYLTVEGSESGRVTQTVIADQSNNRYTRRWADVWSAWVKDATQTDVTALSNRITTNSTQITQNQQAIALKADQATVNNLSGEVSQAQAQLKVQAGQISSKVSSTDFKTLDDKVNGMKIGGRNLLHNTSDQFKALSGSGFLSKSTTSDIYTSTSKYHSGDQFTYSALVTNNSDHPVKLEVWLFYGQDKGTKPSQVNFHSNEAPAHSSNVRLSVTFPIDMETCWIRTYVIYSDGKGTASENIQVAEEQLESGNTRTQWSPNPDDFVASIKKNSTAIDQTNKQISLKADQTTVDKIKNTATQNSSRLDVMNNEINSKVSSTDVNNILDSKGYATQSTVQSLITQKAGALNESITNLEGKFNSSSSVNLAEKTNQGTTNWMCDPGTGTTNLTEVNINGVRGVRFNNTRKTTSWWVAKYVLNLDYFEPNQDYIISFDIRTSSDNFNQGGMLNIARGDSSHPYLANTSFKTNFKQNQLTHVSCTGHSYSSLDKNGETFYLNCAGLGQCDWVDIVNFKIARGKIDKGYSPAPSDNATVTQLQSVTASIDGLQSSVTNYQNDTTSKYTQLSSLMQSKVGTADFDNLKRAVDMQTLDSADINNMKKNGHYFVRNLANNPIGGWVYVDVTGNGNDRIRQDVYQDSGLKHKYRRWFGTYWTGWEEGATYTEITQLQDAINLRVQKGELLSQINLTAGNTLIQTGKLYLDSSSVVFSGRAFIPSAAISELDADKLTFYGNGSKASIGAGIAQYDQDAIKSTINLQYQGGFEIHSSNQLGSILTMHDNTVRLAVKSNGMANPNSPTDQYSGFYASTSYSLMNSYLKDGTTSGISIGSTDSGVNKDYRIHVYDGSNASNNLSKGISISTSSRFDVYAGNSQLFLGPDKAELRGNDHATVHGNDHTFIEGGNEQIYIHDGEVCIGMPGHESDKTSVHLRVFGWADFNGWMNVMGLSQTSLLSTKTRIEPLDTREALDKIMAANVETYQFKSDVAEGKTKRHASVIIDDVHDISQYYTPEEFISENRKGRDDGDIVGYLMGAVQELKKQLDKVKEKINYE